MRNEYLRNLNKIEFVVTYACTGRCKHCSEGEHEGCGERIDPSVAAEAVRSISEAYDIETVMTFGGEPLLYPETVSAIISAAKEMKVPRRQVITNGYFSTSSERVRSVAELLSQCGVNDLLLSVDAFHQETIPIEAVRLFALEVLRVGVPVRLQPAWLVSPEDDNPYNRKTRRILTDFAHICPQAGEGNAAFPAGNTIFPEGNAKKYLSEYFINSSPQNPYVEDPCDIRCVSFSPNGDVLGSNVYKKRCSDILDGYLPRKDRLQNR